MNLSLAIFAYEGRPNAVVKSILSQVVSSGTQANYANHNVVLILLYIREVRMEGGITERLDGGSPPCGQGEREERNACYL